MEGRTPSKILKVDRDSGLESGIRQYQRNIAGNNKEACGAFSDLVDNFVCRYELFTNGGIG